MKFSGAQLDKMSDVFVGLGQLFFASTAVPFIIPSLDKPAAVVVAFGILLSISLWFFAIWIVRTSRL